MFLTGNKFNDLIYGKFGRAIELGMIQEDFIEKKRDVLDVAVSLDIDANLPILESWSFKVVNENNESELLNFQRINATTYFNEVDDTEYFCEFNGIYLANYFYKEKPGFFRNYL